MTMLEKAARALAVDYYNNPEAEQEWRHFVRSARTVLEAVRDDKMGIMHAWIDCGISEDMHPASVFTAMIDHILTEGKSNDPE